MEQRISFITLGVADLARSRAFYEALGWTPHKPKEEQGVYFFQANGLVLCLFPRQELAHDAGVENTPDGGFRGVAIAHNVRSEAEGDAVMAHAVSVGAVCTKPMQKVFWGGYSGYFADPDGHLWEVAYNPFATLGSDGSITL
jgi:catechol 2,3-dioxygenase-like lactoylglutathione lyase family enzyme